MPRLLIACLYSESRREVLAVGQYIAELPRSPWPAHLFNWSLFWGILRQKYAISTNDLTYRQESYFLLRLRLDDISCDGSCCPRLEYREPTEATIFSGRPWYQFSIQSQRDCLVCRSTGRISCHSCRCHCFCRTSLCSWSNGPEIYSQAIDLEEKIMGMAHWLAGIGLVPHSGLFHYAEHEGASLCQPPIDLIFKSNTWHHTEHVW